MNKLKHVCAYYIILFQGVISTWVLTSAPPSLSGQYCPGPMVFTCTGTAVSVAFEWQLDDSPISGYTYSSAHDGSFPRSLSVMAAPPGADIVIIVSMAMVNTEIARSIDIISTLRVSAVSSLNGTSLHCGSTFQSSNIISIETVSGQRIIDIMLLHN